MSENCEVVMEADQITRVKPHLDMRNGRMMRARCCCVFSVLLALGVCALLVTSKPAQEKKDRVHHGKDLSEHAHDDSKDFQYDHEAFLGKEEAKTFDQLTPEESQERLGKIVDKIDSNNDSYVTAPELLAWMKFVHGRFVSEDVDKQVLLCDKNRDGSVSWEEYSKQTYSHPIGTALNRYIYDNVNKHWADYDKDKDNAISWEEYKNTTYGYAAGEVEFYDIPDKETYRKMMKRDERRFKQADKNGDLIATREEFTAFLHPEEFDYMQDLVVTETIEDIDKNGDGSVDVDEYIGDMFTPEAEEPEPEWVKTERQQFKDHRDLNKDGKLDRSEISHWIHPHDYDHADLEAKHLIYESDKDKDDKLTKKEILDNWNMFVGSQATNYGEDLTRRHDEFLGRFGLFLLPNERTSPSTLLVTDKGGTGGDGKYYSFKK
ncbi:unnamed protein product [Ranitomeya imitator]|uniref:EF-hand domain-containing protein n=1 Tax=Ranitomeya imitator TaxID=111125 RepID=A0ABN9LMW9_9NEOB|nr:unnamed protein product [Ranitomeya imitator]